MMPCPIVDEHIDSLSKEAIDRIRRTTHFVVERARTARRFIKSAGHETPISELEIFELDKNAGDGQQDRALQDFLKVLDQGTDVGVLSEAGCPGIADPGHIVVAYAHRHDIKVVPLVGPSSILLGLIASGLNGQNFAFNGYLPNKSPQLIFMEAPYRNGFILEHCMKALSPNVKLSIACDINSPDQYIKTKKVSQWKGTDWKQFHKRVAVFLIGK